MHSGNAPILASHGSHTDPVIHALQTTPLVAPYAAAKAAMLSLARSASIEAKAKGIRIRAILQGAIETPMMYENPDVKSGVEIIDSSEMRQASDVASAIAFSASDDARFVPGASLIVDGGHVSPFTGDIG